MDIAELAFRVDTSGLKRASSEMDKLGSKGKKTTSELTSSGKGLTSSFSGVNRAISSSTESMNRAKSAASGLSSVFAKLGGIVAGLGLASLATDAFDTYRSFESMNASLKTVTGSAEAASAAFKDIQEFAKTTPYTLDQSVEGFQKLKALGLDPSMAALKSYGNTAAAMGKDLTQMIEAVADASTGEFERLKEFGIKSSSEGDKVSFTFQGVTKTIGKNSAEIQAYLRAIGDTKFATAMSDQMETINGKLANLSDSWMGLQVTLMQNGGAQAATMAIESLSSIVVSITENTKEWTIAIGLLAAALLRNKIAAIIASIAQSKAYIQTLFAATAATTAQTRAVGMMGAATVTTTAQVGRATIAMGALRTVMAFMGGPLGLFVLAAMGAYAYKDELMNLLVSVSNVTEAEKLRKQATDKVIELSNEAVGASKKLTAQNKLEAEALLTTAKAALVKAKAQIELNKTRAEDARFAADTATGGSGFFPSEIVGNESAAADAASAASDALIEYKQQLAHVDEIQKMIDSFGKKTIPTGGSGSGSGSGAPSGTPAGGTPPSGGISSAKIDTARQEALRALDALRNAQEIYNDKIKQYDTWLEKHKVNQSEYNKLVAGATAELKRAEAMAAKSAKSNTELTDTQREALRLYKETRTPLEKFNNETERLNKLADAGTITREVANRAIAAAREEYEKADKTILAKAKQKEEAQQKWNDLVKEAKSSLEQAETPLQTYVRRTAEYAVMLEKTAIKQDEYNKLVEKAYSIYEKNDPALKASAKLQEKKNKAIESATKAEKDSAVALDIAKKAINLNDEAVRALTLSYEQGYDEALSGSQAKNEALTKSFNEQRSAVIAAEEAEKAAQKALKLSAESIGKSDEAVRELTLRYTKGYTPALSESQSKAEAAKKANDELRESQKKSEDALESSNKQLKLAKILMTQGNKAKEIQALIDAGIDKATAERITLNNKQISQMEQLTAKTKEWQDGLTDALLDGKSGIEDFFKSWIANAAKAQLQMSLFGENGSGGIFGAMSGSGGILGSIGSFLSKGFSSGGYTGNGGVSDVAGVVHGQEFVVNASATSANRPLLEAMNSGKSVSATSSSGGGDVNVSYSPTINMTGDGSSDETKLRAIMAEQVKIIPAIISRELSKGSVNSRLAGMRS